MSREITLKIESPVGIATAHLPEKLPQEIVVLCHGLPSGFPPDADDPGYPGLGRDLAKLGVAAVTFGFRGCHGTPGDMTLPGLISDLRCVINSALEKFDCRITVVGSSLGGAVAILESAADPRVTRIATLAAPADFHSLADDADSMANRCREIGLFSTPGFPSDVQSWASEFASADIVGAARGLSGRDVLVVHGTEDPVVPSEHAQRIHAAITGSRLQIVQGAGHQLRRDEAALKVLRDWLTA